MTAGLPTPGPERRRKLDAGFADHDQRVRTFETLARALDLPPEVGAFQADFGTPGESGLAQALADLDALRAALAASPDDAALAAEVADHERALEALLDGLPNGGEGWARADLDVNDDGRVDGGDLEAARAAGLPVERGPDDERPGPDGGAGPSGDGGPSGPGPGRFVPAAGGS